MRTRTPLVYLLCLGMLMAFVCIPTTVLADEGYSYDEEYYSEDSPDEEQDQAEELPPPPRTFEVRYDANGGAGTMDPSVFTEGEAAPLRRCAFTREGYTFENWSTTPDGSGPRFIDGADIASSLADDSLTLYAQWGSQIYVIRYVSGVSPEHSFPVTGSMPNQLVVHDAETALLPCGFERRGYTAKGWVDSLGTFHEFEEHGTNFSPDTTTSSWKLAEINLSQARDNPTGDWTCQGSIVFHNAEGATCAAATFIYGSEAYRKGSLEEYDSEIIVVNVDTGEMIAHASGLMLEHGNDIAYNPHNGHFYIAQGGLFDGYPDGIVELDENLNEVRTMVPEGMHHIWNLTYSDGIFYAIGNVDGDSFARGNPRGETSDLIKLDEDLNVLDVRAIDYSPQGFTGQGMVCDGDYLYSIIFRPGEVDGSSKQRLITFTLDGEARGNQYLDMPGEVESGSSLDGHLYFSLNQGKTCALYGTDLAGTTMTAIWEPNHYGIDFDANTTLATGIPESMDLQYDDATTLPDQIPESPRYEFVGWNTKPDGSGEAYEAGQEVQNLAESGRVTLYAQWARPTAGLVGDNGRTVRGKRYRSAPKHMAKTAVIALAAVGLLLLMELPDERTRTKVTGTFVQNGT